MEKGANNDFKIQSKAFAFDFSKIDVSLIVFWLTMFRQKKQELNFIHVATEQSILLEYIEVFNFSFTPNNEVNEMTGEMNNQTAKLTKFLCITI